MKSLSYVIALAAATGLTLTGCGTEPTGTPPPTVPPMTTDVSQPPTLPTAPPDSPFPFTVNRTGGFAGFDDAVVVAEDGIATVRKRGQAPIRCQLAPALFADLATALKRVDWRAVGVTKPSTRHPDDMIIAVAAAGGLTRLDDPKVQPLVAPVGKLLTEATVPPGRQCQPV